MQVTHWIPVDGAELAVEYRPHEDGRAPLVFLHAGVTDSRLWDGAMEAAAGRRSALRIDRRGFGQTRVSAARPHAWVEDLRAVLDALQLDRVALVGCSLGGRIAIDFALASPERVAGLVLVAPGVTGAPDSTPELDDASRTLNDATQAARTAGQLDEINRLQAHLWLDGPGQPEGRVGGAARELFLAMNRIALHAPAIGDLQPAPDAWPRLGQLAVPTHVVCGDLDLHYLVQRCRQMAERIPGARHVALRGQAHLPSLEAPAAFNHVLQDAGLLAG